MHALPLQRQLAQQDRAVIVQFVVEELARSLRDLLDGLAALQLGDEDLRKVLARRGEVLGEVCLL